jgi:hypothetical protein
LQHDRNFDAAFAAMSGRLVSQSLRKRKENCVGDDVTRVTLRRLQISKANLAGAQIAGV